MGRQRDPLNEQSEAKNYSLRSTPERVVLVGVQRPLRAKAPGEHVRFLSEESLEELARLSDTAGLEVAGRVVQNLRDGIHPATFIGTGKVGEVKEAIAEQHGQAVIFDDDLSPAQQRNLEKALGVKVVDRSQLILDIFAQHAKSLAGKLQVELAQLEYLRPRLTRQWVHLSRLGGGGVGTRGPGETQLEVDRRRLRERIATLHRRLADVERTRTLQRQERTRTPFPCVALVGYTNAGKSTLMNTLTRAGVLVEDKLFATLDPTSRRLDLPSGQPVMLIDTVGFINKLPHQLIDAFKSTLEEVRSADLLLHVVDATHSRWEEQKAVVEEVLAEIGAEGKPVLTVLNKLDLRVDTPDDDIEHPWQRAAALARSHGESGVPDVFGISALTGAGLPPLLDAIARRLEHGHEVVQVDLPLGAGKMLAWLRRSGKVLEEAYSETAVSVTASVSSKIAGQLRKQIAAGVLD
ncbi:MAG: GTPase HflX [Deltaproteobacteria bacterium]|nr:GTPase HflX [Deltaproteobacteria bacterium]